MKNKFTILLAILCLFSCRSTNYLSSIAPSKQTVNADLGVGEDESITALIQPYKIKLDAKMNQVIGHTSVDLTKKRPESTLGNWMADAIQRQTEKYLGTSIAFAIQNYGGMRISKIKKGEITRGKIYELMPFDNTVVVLTLSSAEVQELIKHITAGGGWPVSHSIKVSQDRLDEFNILIEGKPLEMDKTYKVALPDYVANGGSDSKFLKNKPRQELPLFIRDILIADLEEHTANDKVIESKVEGRIVLIEN